MGECMEILERVFAKPFEVTQFWASDKYLATGMSAGNTMGRLYKYCPKHVRQYQPAQDGDWFFAVSDGEDGPATVDFLPRILPTRRNIAALDLACVAASKILAVEIGKGPITENRADDGFQLTGLVPYHGMGEMTLANDAYRRDLWEVFAQDWGLDFPLPERFGSDAVTVTHRPGLPCAAAMVRAVLPVIEAVHGDLELVRQSTSSDSGRKFDVVEYRRADGWALVQRYDITDVFGRHDLDWKCFQF